MNSTKKIDHTEYFNKINCELMSVINLTPEEQFSYLQNVFKHHIQAFPFHNFELRDLSHIHPLNRNRLSLFKMNDFIKGCNGGFCFQTSLILYSALISAGFNVYCSIAKVVNGLAPESLEAKKIPATHLVLVVNIDGNKYLLDPSMGMSGHCSPFLIPASNDCYQQNNQNFKIEKNKNDFLFYRQINSSWSLMFCSSLLPQDIKTITMQLTKLASFPNVLGIRDTIVLIGIATPTGGKSLLWNPKNKTFTFKIINSQTSDKEETFDDLDRAYNLLQSDFKIAHISKLQFKQCCEENHWPRLKSSIDVDFPIDDYEISKIKRNFC